MIKNQEDLLNVCDKEFTKLKEAGLIFEAITEANLLRIIELIDLERFRYDQTGIIELSKLKEHNPNISIIESLELHYSHVEDEEDVQADEADYKLLNAIKRGDSEAFITRDIAKQKEVLSRRFNLFWNSTFEEAIIHVLKCRYEGIKNNNFLLTYLQSKIEEDFDINNPDIPNCKEDIESLINSLGYNHVYIIDEMDVLLFNLPANALSLNYKEIKELYPNDVVLLSRIYNLYVTLEQNCKDSLGKILENNGESLI